ncbi:MAG: ATP-binding protein [Endomicrobium sp.]|jgi:predicted AAA+ superfamily ATPase|nr:ATP-binding protein [Endomicrobium sp.]
MENYIHRKIEQILLKAIKNSPVIAVTGPRQTGKSTMLKELFAHYNYVSFDFPDIREAAQNDPATFIENLKTPVIIDEIQYAPEILPYIKIMVDKYTTALRNDEINGKFILTGSQAFTMMAGLTESLAGRISLFELLPFSFSELKSKPIEPIDCYKQMLKGFYPIPNITQREPQDYYSDYLTTYIERDVRQILNIKDASVFQTFVQVLAARAGNLLDIADIAKDCGISSITAKNWLSVLEVSRIIYLLRPYFKNITKRVIKTPKIYFTDTGLLAHLLKFNDANALMADKISGAFFENMIIMEALKNKFNNKANDSFYFYRDSNGVEIDLVIDKGQSFNLYEIKASKTIRADMTKSLTSTSLNPSQKFLISFNEMQMPIVKGVMAIPWQSAFI